MAQLYLESQPLSLYTDRQLKVDEEERNKLLAQSTTLYVGNLSFFTTEEQIYEVFSKCGEVRRIIMGLDKRNKTPCGFCFVEYYARADTEDAQKYINGTRIDDRIVRTDFDTGFVEGRQWGRGRHGGQVRDEYRTDYDPGRGGYGHQAQEVQTPGRGMRDSARGKRERDYSDHSESKRAAVSATAAANPRFRDDKREDEDEDVA